MLRILVNVPSRDDRHPGRDHWPLSSYSSHRTSKLPLSMRFLTVAPSAAGAKGLIRVRECGLSRGCWGLIGQPGVREAESPSQEIDRALHSPSFPVQHMGVDHRRLGATHAVASFSSSSTTSPKFVLELPSPSVSRPFLLGRSRFPSVSRPFLLGRSRFPS